MKDLFISHSSVDKVAVENLVEKLEALGIAVWYDKDNILVGDDCEANIQQGIEESSYLAIWITESALNSGWVEREWTQKYKAEVSSGIIKVLPLLADNCKEMLPMELASKRCADFYTNYDIAFDELVRKVNKNKKRVATRKISFKVESYLDHLKNSKIDIPLIKSPIRIVNNLKEIPRSGKKIRFHQDCISLPTRSVYDHILSVAHTADCIWNEVDGLKFLDDDIAKMIAYHDVCEVLLGDVPTYTPLNENKRFVAQIIGEKRYGALPKESASPESITNDFIYMFLANSARESMLAVEELMKNKESKKYKLFILLDKIDPIIAIWRYLYIYKNEINNKHKNFLNVVSDFFNNADVKKVASAYEEDIRFFTLVDALQDIDNATGYLKSDNYWDGLFVPNFGFNKEIVKNIIEERKLIFPKSEKQNA